MKNPVNIAKKSYNKILKIDDLAWRLEQIENTQESILQQLSTMQEQLQTQLSAQIHDSTIEAQKKLDSITSLIKYTHDITKIPQAQGYEQITQKANFILYKEIARILKKHKITFYLDFGILIGMIRHNGFIPWDDDIDISVPRCEYDTLPKIFDSAFQNTGLFYIESEVIRVYYKNTPLQLDIFPIDFYDKRLNDSEKDALKAKVIDYGSHIKFDWDKLFTQERVIISPTKKGFRDIFHRDICNKDIDAKTAQKLKSTIIHSPELPRFNNTLILDYEDIFPLKETTFMGEKIFIPHNPNAMLVKNYGDYFSFPRDIGYKHKDIDSRISESTIFELQKIVNAGKLPVRPKV